MVGKRWVLVLLPMLGGCLERVEGPQEAGGSVPAAVQAVFDGSCNAQTGCHADSAGGLLLDASGAFLNQDSPVGRPIVDPGNLANSQLAVRVQAGEMPPPGTLELGEEDRFIILGWIADGAPLAGGASAGTGGGTGMPEDIEDIEDMGMTSTTEVDVSSDNGDAMEGSSSVGSGVDAFAPVLAIVQANCGGSTCHRDGGRVMPDLSDAAAYTSLLEGMSVTGAPLVDPGSAQTSQLTRRITADGFGPMPPAPAEPLDAASVATIVAWIDDGAMP